MKKALRLPVVALLLAVVLTTAVLPAASAEPTERLLIEYRPGKGAQVREAVQAGGGQIHHQFDRINAMAITVTGGVASQLAKNPNVVSVEPDPVRYLDGDPDPYVEQVMPYGIDYVQAPKAWKMGATGEGVKVCIIDTGFYADHEDLKGLRVDGYSQVDDDWARDGYGHGTHVAGTITALDNERGVIGVSPGNVDLFIVKIFDDDGLWVSKAHASDLIAAAYKCADNEAKIISMSLGGSNSSGKEEQAFDALYEQGVLSVAAAGNEGTDADHYPASYSSVVSVGAIDSTYTVADFSQYNNQTELAAPGVSVLSTVPFLAVSELVVDGVTYDAHHIEFAAYGEASGALVDGGLCDATGSWSGKVVLCERGEISFYDKVMNVQNSGGAAAVIYNNEPGNFYGTLGDGNSSEIVAISLSQEDGQYLVANKLGAAGEVTSSVSQPDSGYEAWGGTSMATPHVSGVAALLWSVNENWTNVEIREAMVSTAMDLGDPGWDPYYGHGLVQAWDALRYLQGPSKGPKRP